MAFPISDHMIVDSFILVQVWTRWLEWLDDFSTASIITATSVSTNFIWVPKRTFCTGRTFLILGIWFVPSHYDNIYEMNRCVSPRWHGPITIPNGGLNTWGSLICPPPSTQRWGGGAGLGGPSAEVDSHSTLRLRHVLAVEFQIHRPWSRVIWAILWWDVSGVESKAAQTQNCSPDWADWGRWDIDDVRCETYGDLHGMSANQNRGCGHEPWEMLRYGHASQ